MPCIGLGTYTMEPGFGTFYPVLNALHAGYRLIDTAAIYENEQDVGRAIAESEVDRLDVFIVTKLHEDNHGYRTVKDYVYSNSKLEWIFSNVYVFQKRLSNVSKTIF